jgi:methionine-rich copper-binding protein CopC
MQLSTGRPGPRTIARRALDIALGIGLLVVVTTSVSPEAAYAHDTVASSVPAAGSTVALVPDTVTVRFEGTVSRAAVEVTDGCGDRVPVRVTVAGTRLTAALQRDPAADAGAARAARWTAGWKAVGSDGHLVHGEIPFTVRDTRCGSGPALTADDDSAGHGGAGHFGGSGVGAQADTAPAAETRGLPMLPVGAAILAVLGLLAVALTRRRPGGERA